MARKALPFTLIAFIIQIIFWVELNEIGVDGTSNLTRFTNVVMFILVLINVLWVDITIHQWENYEKSLARSFGTAREDGSSSTNEPNRILF